MKTHPDGLSRALRGADSSLCPQYGVTPVRMTSMGSQVAAPTSACLPTATRRGPAGAALASAWEVTGSPARVSDREGVGVVPQMFLHNPCLWRDAEKQRVEM